MNEEQFNALVDEIMSRGYSEAIAAEYAAAIGDTPLRDELGRIVVIMDNGTVARLAPLKFFDGR